MAKEFDGQTEDGTTTEVYRRSGQEVKSGLLVYNKTGAGTCTLKAINAKNLAELPGATVALASGAQSGNLEFPLPAETLIEVADRSGSISVTASIDGSAA